MPSLNISAQVTAEDLTAIKAHLAGIREKLPFLLVLSDDERRSLFKMGPGRVAFVQNSLQAAKNNTGMLSRDFAVEEFEKDVVLTSVLVEVRTLVRQLDSDIDDTTMAVGSEAANAAAQVYGFVKAAVSKSPGLKPIADQLGESFKRANNAGGTPPPAPAVK